MWFFFFPGFFDKESSKEQNLFEIETICNIINVFTVNFDQQCIIAVLIS